jgi:hypothetical protein
MAQVLEGFGLSEASNVLKVVYLPPVREMLDNATPLLKYVEKEIQELAGGSDFVIPLHVGRNDAAGDGAAENGTLRLPGKQGYAKTSTRPKYLYGRIQVSGPVIAATKNNKGAFLKALESEMKGLMTDTKRAFNRQLHGDGLDVLAVATAGRVDANNLVVHDGLGNRFEHLNKTTLVDIRDVSNVYTLLNTALSVTRGAPVTGPPVGRNVVTTGAFSATIAVGDVIVKTGTWGNQMQGLKGIVSAADPLLALYPTGLQGLTVAAEPTWAAQVVYGDGGSSELTGVSPVAGRVDISFESLLDLETAISTESDRDASDIDLFMSSPGLKNQYIRLCRNERVFFNNMKLDGGFSAVTYNTKPWVWDNQCARNRVYALIFESLMLARLAELDWIDVGGDVLYRIDGGNQDAVGATLFAYQEFAVKERNANGVLLNINE